MASATGKAARTACVAVSVLLLCLGVLSAACLSNTDLGSEFSNAFKHFFSVEIELASGGKGEEVYDVGNFVLFVLLAGVLVVNFLLVVPALVVTLRRRCKPIPAKLEKARAAGKEQGAAADIEVVVPCYLPNEEGIIEETIQHILEKLEAPAGLTLWVVYNTPKEMPEIETRLDEMSQRTDLPHGRRLVVLKVEGSRSKAENLNKVLPLLSAPFTAIYDADHHPDPKSLLLLYEKVERRGVDCAQGSTYIRDLSSGLVARLIDAEFFVTHFLYFPCSKMITRNAVFGGSNALWRREVLGMTTFDHKLQTEDIDLSIRMLLQGRYIDFCPEARSGELAPVSLRALFKQRLRWAIGWDQVSFRHFKHICCGSQASRSRKVGIAYLLYTRWLMQIIGVIAGIVTPILGLLPRFDRSLCHCGLGTQLLQSSLFYFYILLMLCVVMEALMQVRHRGRESCIQVFFVGVFMGLGWAYILWQGGLIMVSFFRIATGSVGGWVVTARSAAAQQKKEVQPEEEPPADASAALEAGLASRPEPAAPREAGQDAWIVVDAKEADIEKPHAGACLGRVLRGSPAPALLQVV